jgi:hypothetical protein
MGEGLELEYGIEVPIGVPDELIVHVCPVGDLRGYETEGRGKCWCGVGIGIEGGTWIVVHNSMDGRELYEDGRRLMG